MKSKHRSGSATWPVSFRPSPARWNWCIKEQTALLMEFVLHGFASYSLINKKMIKSKVEFKEPAGSMMNFKQKDFGLNEEA